MDPTNRDISGLHCTVQTWLLHSAVVPHQHRRYPSFRDGAKIIPAETLRYEMSYWEQLSHLKQYSLERRRERCRIIYIWRILVGHVPNLISSDGNSEKVTAKWHKRRGRECIVPRVNRNSPQRKQTLIYASLPVRGQQLFNILPARIGNMTGCSVDCLRRKLDGYFNTVPDEPQIPGYTAQRRAKTNSLIDMARFSPAHHQLNVEVPGDSLTHDSRGCATNITVAHWCKKNQQGNKVTNIKISCVFYCFITLRSWR